MMIRGLLPLAVLLVSAAAYWAAPVEVIVSPASVTDGRSERAAINNASSDQERPLYLILRQKFNTIDRVTTQIRLHHHRQALLKKAMFAAQVDGAIRQAFPQLADDLFELFSLLEQYQHWLMAENRTLLSLSALEREGYLWQKRFQLFGERARNIWQEERDDYEQQQLTMQAELQRLHKAQQPLMTTLQEFQTLVNDHASVGAGLSSGAVAGAYFSLDSVQSQLKAMSSSQRRQAIDQLRQQMGMGDVQRQRLAKRDRRREQRWQLGHYYMQQRRALSDQYDGEAFRQALIQVQQNIFEHEAETIAREEAQGFFRYQRPRVYGRN